MQLFGRLDSIFCFRLFRLRKAGGAYTSPCRLMHAPWTAWRLRSFAVPLALAASEVHGADRFASLGHGARNIVQSANGDDVAIVAKFHAGAAGRFKDARRAAEQFYLGLALICVK